jgi:hypothetical protein
MRLLASSLFNGNSEETTIRRIRVKTVQNLYPWAFRKSGETGGERPSREDAKYDPFLTTKGLRIGFPLDSSGCLRHLTQGAFTILIRVGECNGDVATV